MRYQAPIAEMKAVLTALGHDRLGATGCFPDLSPETEDAILAEAARLAEEVLVPLNRAGDQYPARLENGIVRTSPGFSQGYKAIAEGGWVGITASPVFGGMGLPVTINACVHEMLGSGCLALELCTLLTQGQIEALECHANDEIKAIYLPKLITGEWTGTMNLTEPQAGSDVGALRTRAEPAEDGSYRITGQKIFITWGDHDLADNVCHLVLARLPGAPAGTRGISLFLVPKWLPDAEGHPGPANSLRVVSLEHKMGLHGSPTAVMEYDGAAGWLIGEEQGGLAAMFTMMNNARLGVGIEGIATAEAAFQAALAYARERHQGRTVTGSPTIIGHPDVRRNLLTMAALTRSARAICLDCALAIDMANATADPGWAARAALLTPVAKAFGTDIGCEVASLALQVHGGAGYIEESGIPQLYRDVRVTPIYEGTNGIQAADLVGRKLADGGAAFHALIDEIDAAAGKGGTEAVPLRAAAKALRETVEWMLAASIADRLAGSSPFLRATGLILGAHHLLRAAGDNPARKGIAQFHRDQLLPMAEPLLRSAREGMEGLGAVDALDPIA